MYKENINHHALITRLLCERHKIYEDDDCSQWALFFELQSSTGHATRLRRADAFAINLWPSKKLHRVAYEIKLSRSDFLRELKAPEKRSWAMDVSNEFYFVTVPGVIQSRDEVPEGCGWLQVTKNGASLRALKPAKQRFARALSDAEIAAIIRKAKANKLVSEMRWHYSGKEINADGLDLIIRDEMDRVVKEEIETRVTAEIDKRLSLLNRFLEEMNSAFVEEGFDNLPYLHRLTGTTSISKLESLGIPAVIDRSHIKNWIANNVCPGPGDRAIQGIRRQLDSIARQVSNVIRDVSSVKTDK